jgi:hypothetical protein
LPEVWPQIRAGWDRFQSYLDSDTPPPLTERDTRLRDDREWIGAASAYIKAKQAADDSAAALDAAKAALIGLATHSSEAGGGVQVSRFWKQGNIDYKRAPALKDIDLEPFRGKGREEVRVSIAK